MAITTIARPQNLAIVLGGAFALAACVWAGLGPGRGRNAPEASATPTRPVVDLARLASPGSEGPRAEELHALGVGLMGRGRMAEGWAALEASRRIDPDHQATRRALDDLESGLRRATGPDREALRAAVAEVEHLRSIRGGPALGLLAMALARYGEPEGRGRDLLDRLAARDRDELRAVADPPGAVRLVARLLMETGRPAEAEAILRPIAEADTDDRETAWLLSRAELQLGRVEPAAAWRERAGDFGGKGGSPEPSPYVGSRRCAACHPTAAHAHEASPHAQTLYRGNGLADVPLPDRPVPDPEDPHLHHAFTREAPDRIRLEARDDRGRVARAIVAYALGSGTHGITMVAREDPGGTPHQIRVSYYADGPSWRATKGVAAAPHSVDEFLGLALSEKALRECLHCHATWFRAAMPDPSATTGPEASDRGIGCERCHGPGLNHVKAVELAFPDAAIADARDASPQRLLESCAECHASNGTVAMSDPEFARFQGTTLKFSRCYTGSGGAIHCATCHDPHRGLDRTTSRYEAKCLDCHAAKPGAHPCPVNPSTGCIDCHMPKVEDPGFQARFTNHHIRIHRAVAGK